MTTLVKWPSIESFHNIRKATAKYPHILNGNHKVVYRGKCKLHGTNSAIQFLDDDIVAQSRSTILKPGHDNAGFAAWVNKYVRPTELTGLAGYTVFGEWCGPGINKGCSIHMIEEKVFAIFAMMKENPDFTVDCMETAERHFIADPDEIENILRTKGELDFLEAVPNTYVIPWHTANKVTEEVVVDWNSSAEALGPLVKDINTAVDEVEACDPWVKETFGKEGTGEGIVYYPVSKEHLGRDNFSALAFKAKGEKHKIVKAKAPVVIDPAVAASVAEFVDLVVTEPRLEQGVQEACGGEYELRKIGPFIGHIGKDVSKECQAELEASELTWKQVSKSVTNRAREWYIAKTEEL